MDRLKLAVGIAIGVLTGSPWAAAAYTVPAVNLPAQTPDIVRDRVARSLASTRDQVGRVLYPSRGEFHGLGIFPLGGNYVTDLSGDGRVVVGYDNTLTAEARPFVWSPATGKVNYNMLPSGATGTARPTAVSADGVYVGGSTWTDHFNGPYYAGSSTSGFLWSLAGSTRLPSNQDRNLTVSALSGDGKVVVGTQSRRSYIGYGTSVDYVSNLDHDDVWTPYQWAYRYTRAGVLEELGVLPNGAGHFVHAAAVDVTRDGNTVLVNGVLQSVERQSGPFLWAANGAVRSLGKYDPYGGATSSSSPLRTTAFAISADGSTVVGAAADPYFDYNAENYKNAILWREETGWSDLGELKSPANHHTIVGYEATGVSGDGSVVIGHANLEMFVCDCQYNPSYKIPFHWDEARGMRDLGDVLRYDYGLDLSDWYFYDVAGISDDGTTIIGNGLSPDRNYEAWRAVLHRNTPLGDIDFDGDIDPHDYAQLTSNLGADLPPSKASTLGARLHSVVANRRRGFRWDEERSSSPKRSSRSCVRPRWSWRGGRRFPKSASRSA